MKALTLNIECGKRLPAIKKYLLSKLDYDFILLQEVAGGYRYKLQYQEDKFDINNFESINTYREINKVLNKNFNGYLSKSYSDSTEEHFLGNAIFINKKHQRINYKEVLLGGNKHIDISETSHSNVGYTLQIVEMLDIDISILNTHIIKYEADKKLAKEYFQKVKSVVDQKKRFILGGDFNIDYTTDLFNKTFSKYKIVNKDFDIKNTLNKDIHRLFVNDPQSIGLSVDNFITSEHIYPINIAIECDKISDHYPVIFEFNIDEQPNR